MTTPTESPQRIPMRPEIGIESGEALPTPNRKMTDSRPSRRTVIKQAKKRPLPAKYPRSISLSLDHQLPNTVMSPELQMLLELAGSISSTTTPDTDPCFDGLDRSTTSAPIRGGCCSYFNMSDDLLADESEAADKEIDRLESSSASTLSSLSCSSAGKITS